MFRIIEAAKRQLIIFQELISKLNELDATLNKVEQEEFVYPENPIPAEE